MDDWHTKITTAPADFKIVAELAGTALTENDLECRCLAELLEPHFPRRRHVRRGKHEVGVIGRWMIDLGWSTIAA